MEGVQRIRGLAGSGKTIVLALKAAYLHALNPELKIAVTFNTRSLKGQFKELIRRFTYAHIQKEPDWNKLKIIHAWGAPGGGERTGMYYQFCLQNGVKYYDYSSAIGKWGREGVFSKVCKEALQEAKSFKPEYDVILVDEAQDFSLYFLRICYEMLPEHDKRLVYAYDELQNLGKESLPSPEELFGNDKNGNPRVKFGEDNSEDIILGKCYRNSRPALVTAHALGFGIYRNVNDENENSIIQIFENKKLWEDIGYKVRSGVLNDGEHVVLERSQESSPKFLENHSDIDDLIKFKKFDSIEEQSQWIVSEIIHNLKEDELCYNDIVVINPNPVTTVKAVAPIRSLLFEKQIKSHTAGIDSEPDIFFDKDRESIPFTGIYRAKGNEAAMVYVINAQDCYYEKYNLATLRNRLFTAITRSKAWVRVVGVGEKMQGLIDEFERIKAHNFTLDFIYPTEEERKKIKIINRDISKDDQKKIERYDHDLYRLMQDIKNGNIPMEKLGMLKDLVKLVNEKR